MTRQQNQTPAPTSTTLVLGGTGKTGRRIVDHLLSLGEAARVGSRAASPPFDWDRPATWDACLEGIRAVYVSFAPDLAVPGATDTIRVFVDRARQRGVDRLVLLSGRGEEEARACEKIVQDSGLDWTVIRASWFAQNFSEGAFASMVQAGHIGLPAGDVPEPFVDVDDIADIAVAALTGDGHSGEVYEVTGPRAMTFADVAEELSKATGRPIQFTPITHADFIADAEASGAPKDVIWLLGYLFSTVLDGRNSSVQDGVQRALGRPPRDFADYARNVAATGLWRAVA